jgi:DNA polymerase-3 subunit alpha
MDSFGDTFGRRAQVMAALDKAIEQSQKAQRDAESGQHGLFGVFEPEQNTNAERLPNTPDWDEHTRLAYEKEILGFFITGHPLEKYADKLADFHARTVEEVMVMKSTPRGGEEVLVGGILVGVKSAKSRKGEMYAQGGLEDMTGKVNILVFSEAYKRLQMQDKLNLDVPVLVRASVRAEEGANATLTLSDITPLEEATPKLARSLRIRIPLETATAATVDALHVLFREKTGAAKVLFDVERAGDFMAVMEAEGYNVLPDRGFMNRVEELCGRGSVRVID